MRSRGCCGAGVVRSSPWLAARGVRSRHVARHMHVRNSPTVPRGAGRACPRAACLLRRAHRAGPRHPGRPDRHGDGATSWRPRSPRDCERCGMAVVNRQHRLLTRGAHLLLAPAGVARGIAAHQAADQSRPRGGRRARHRGGCTDAARGDAAGASARAYRIATLGPAPGAQFHGIADVHDRAARRTRHRAPSGAIERARVSEPVPV